MLYFRLLRIKFEVPKSYKQNQNLIYLRFFRGYYFIRNAFISCASSPGIVISHVSTLSDIVYWKFDALLASAEINFAEYALP